MLHEEILYGENSSETLPKEFVKTTELHPLVTYGISSIDDLRKAETEIHFLEKLKKAGLTAEEVKLYHDNESGILDQCMKIESSVLKQKLDTIYEKLNKYEKTVQSSADVQEPSSTSNKPDDIFAKLKDKPITIYPDPHPMNNLKEIEENLFGHLRDEVTLSNTKRKKALRRFERIKERILTQEGRVQVPTTSTQTVNREGSLWDVKELPKTINTEQIGPNSSLPQNQSTIGPEPKPVMYTIKNNKIVRLETLPGDRGVQVEEFQAVDIVVPNNEEQLLEGTKMSVDDIRKMERFQNYEPGKPSKVLYLKNIAPSVTSDQLSLLFNQFVLANGGPVDVRLLTGRMRGQAFVHMQTEDLAIQALEEINGTILEGRPIIAQFARDRHRADNEHDRNHMFRDDNDENQYR